ncbi:hypothetical protein BKA63DRAFT_582526 [Paraphoma chrysanthemicola]|nr:hypothetical protein BKA63DRAFT_582526 [Paraphoma chrysanthemicola]
MAEIPYSPYFTFTFQVTETCSNGKMCTSALWIHHDFQKQFLVSDMNPVTVKINGKLLGIIYKAPPSVVEYEYDGCRWTSGHTNSIGNNYCAMSIVEGSWSRPPLSCSGAKQSRRAIWTVSVKGGFPDIEIDPRGASMGTAEPTIELARALEVTPESSLERRADCPPYGGCHPKCEKERRTLSECVCMKLTCGQGGSEYQRIKGQYDSCCAANKPPAPETCGAVLGTFSTIDARGADKESNPTNVTEINPKWSLNPSKALLKDGNVGYFPFSVSVTEYCEATEGTPLKARGYFAPEGENGLNLNFDDGNLAYSIPIGWGNLLVGGYDWWLHKLHFHYNGCHWDQDLIGVGQCGFCKSRPWTSGPINCAINAGAGRNHGIDCMVAVAYD